MAKNAKTAVIQLPPSDTLQTASLSNADLEKLVMSILGGQTGRGIDAVKLKGGQASGPTAAQPDWSKTIWSRNC